jgi:septum site-determining protein MinC
MTDAVMPEALVLKGGRDGLLATIHEAAEWPAVEQALLARIDQGGEFFKGAKLTLLVGPRALSAAELGHLRDVLADHGVQLRGVVSDSAPTTSAAQALGLTVALPASLPQNRPDPEVDPEEDRDSGVLVRHTLRSGRRIHSGGHITVIGDVNPGAEVVAGGDIVVWGRLRGMAHAGANGDEGAVVCALDLAPTQLRIADQIATSPDRRGDPKPEIARVKDGQIVAERWTPNLKNKAESE